MLVRENEGKYKLTKNFKGKNYPNYFPGGGAFTKRFVSGAGLLLAWGLAGEGNDYWSN